MRRILFLSLLFFSSKIILAECSPPVIASFDPFAVAIAAQIRNCPSPPPMTDIEKRREWTQTQKACFQAELDCKNVDCNNGNWTASRFDLGDSFFGYNVVPVANPQLPFPTACMTSCEKSREACLVNGGRFNQTEDSAALLIKGVQCRQNYDQCMNRFGPMGITECALAFSACLDGKVIPPPEAPPLFVPPTVQNFPPYFPRIDMSQFRKKYFQYFNPRTSFIRWRIQKPSMSLSNTYNNPFNPTIRY